MFSSNSPLIVAIENAARLGSDSGAIGDLFFMGDGVYFVAYDMFGYGGTAGKTAGYLVGGVVGYGISRSMDKENIAHASGKALKIREKQYGLSLKERLDAHPWSLSIPLGSIESLRFAGNNTRLVCTRLDGKALEFQLPTLSVTQTARIRTYLDPELKPEVDASQYGFNLPYLAPPKLLEALEENVRVPDEQTQRLIAENETYMRILYKQLIKTKKDGKTRVCDNIKQYQTLRAALIQAAAKERRSVPKSIPAVVTYFTSALFLVLLVFIDLDDISTWSADSSIPLFILGNAFFISIIVLMVVFNIVRPLQKGKNIINRLT